jgi:hypothetical protein
MSKVVLIIILLCGSLWANPVSYKVEAENVMLKKQVKELKEENLWLFYKLKTLEGKQKSIPNWKEVKAVPAGNITKK